MNDDFSMVCLLFEIPLCMLTGKYIYIFAIKPKRKARWKFIAKSSEWWSNEMLKYNFPFIVNQVVLLPYFEFLWIFDVEFVSFISKSVMMVMQCFQCYSRLSGFNLSHELECNSQISNQWNYLHKWSTFHWKVNGVPVTQGKFFSQEQIYFQKIAQLLKSTNVFQ